MICPKETQLIHLSYRMFFVFGVTSFSPKQPCCGVSHRVQTAAPGALPVYWEYLASVQMPRFDSRQEVRKFFSLCTTGELI